VRACYVKHFTFQMQSPRVQQILDVLANELVHDTERFRKSISALSDAEVRELSDALIQITDAWKPGRGA
jgi:hypothetical protein